MAISVFADLRLVRFDRAPRFFFDMYLSVARGELSDLPLITTIKH